MALKAGYKGIKKIGTGLKLTTEGTLSLDGGSVNLEDLGDVAITEPANGNILVYDSTDEEWKNSVPASVNLDDLGDVTITEPANGNILVYDSTDEEWKNAVPASAADKADITAIGTNETGDTASKAYAAGEHFYKNGKFCTAKADIAQGAMFTLNTNYVEGTIADSITDKLIYETGHTNQSVTTKLSGLKTAFENLSFQEKKKSYIYLLASSSAQGGDNIRCTNTVGVFEYIGDSSDSLLRKDIIRLADATPTWRGYTFRTSGITIDTYTFSTTFNFQLWVSGK